jgi:putative hemolysin
MTSDKSRDEGVTFSAGSLHAFTATSQADIERSQRLRYSIFFDEMGAEPSPEMRAAGRDFDEYDDFCDHLLIEDISTKQIVGTYRILRRSQLPAGKKFYTENEFDLSKTLSHFKGEVMELGRACVDINYRDRATIQLLWRAIGEYTAKYNVELMFGCGSFSGSDYNDHAVALSYLYNHHLAPTEFRPSAVAESFKPINLMTADKYDAKRVLATMPPLLKGYLRLGGFIGDGAFEDQVSNTTDVCVVLETNNISQKYFDKFAASNAAKN